MEGQLALIQYQLWALIALLVAFVVGNIFCYYLSKPEKKASQEFSNMWDRGKIDELLRQSEKFIKEYPNHADALYYRAKALLARKRYSEAKELLESLLQTHPNWAKSVNSMFEVIENEIS